MRFKLLKAHQKFISIHFIHSYSFIENRNDRTHLHKYTQYKKNIKTVKAANNSTEAKQKCDSNSGQKADIRHFEN